MFWCDPCGRTILNPIRTKQHLPKCNSCNWEQYRKRGQYHGPERKHTFEYGERTCPRGHPLPTSSRTWTYLIREEVKPSWLDILSMK